MAAIESLLRVMTLRDAEAIVLEAGKIPTLRRRGQLEQMAMPAIEAGMLEEFAAPHVAGKEQELAAGPMMVSITIEQTGYVATIERVGGGGLRVTARKAGAKPAAKTGAGTGTGTAAGTGTGTAAGTGTGTAAGTGSRSSPSPSTSTSTSTSTTPSLLRSVSASASASDTATVSDTATDSRADRNRLSRLLSHPITIAHERGASDVLLSTGQPPRMRLDGRLETLDASVDDAELAAACAGVGSIDFSLELDGVRVRVNAFEHMNGVAVAARLVKEHVPGIGELGLPQEIAQIVELRDGLVLVCGPTGSGKSTTIAALVDLLDQRRAAHVITIEDPIEYRFQPRRCLVHQREIGTHVATFAAGVRAALREVPDVIVLGELRDRETLAAALTAAETGHLVLATLHAPGAAGAIDRVIDAFPENQQRQVRQQLAACLRTVVTQYLLPRRDGGRAVAAELVPVTAAVANIIRKGDLHTLPTAIQSGREAGMIPLERSLAKLLDTGAVAPTAVKRIAADHDLLAALAGKLR